MEIRPPQLDRPLRIGAVRYLNSKPLVRHLAAALPEWRVSFDLPSRLADDLASGQLDVALVPIVEYLRRPEFMIVSDACIACRGPVMSVKLYFRVPPADVRRLALDEGSRTSAALAQVLLAKLHGVRPELCELPIGHQLEETDADAVLLIGDRAMRPPAERFVETWDLGDCWCRWAELPFVFAAWIARPGLPVDLAELAATLEGVRDLGVAACEAIAREEAAELGLPEGVAYEYLTKNLHFTLGPDERRGIERFAGYCRELGLVEERV